MADVELVIKIPKRVYNYIRKYEHIANSDISDIKDAIINSIQFPKGHGRLIDADDLLDNTCLEEIPTIIEADKRESEEEE